MAKAKSARKALFMSVLSMLLCCTMLIGTTFAWFTDSVTTGVNRIVAGNLDVELYYSNVSTNGEWNDAKEVPEKNPTFFVSKDGKEILWEPGVVAYAQFKVVNNGSLALKYNLYTLANYNYIEGTERSLKDVIKFSVFKGAQEFETRDDIAKVEDEDKLVLWKSLDNFTANGNLEAGENDIFTVVAYWEPGADDNYYNVKDTVNVTDLYADDGVTDDALVIDFDINLRATQYTAEEDSFDNQYDAKSEYDDGIALITDFSKEFSSAINASEPTVIQNDGLKVTLPAGTCTEGDIITLNSTLVEFGAVDEATNSQTTTYNIEVLRNGTKIEADGIEVTVYVGKGFTNLTVLHNGDEITEKHYDAQTGEVTFITNSFSPYSFIATMPRKISTAEGLTTAIENGEKVVLTSDVTVDSIIEVKDGKTAVVDLNGQKLSGNGQRVFSVTAGCSAEISNGTVESEGYGVVSTGGTVKLTNLNINAANYAVAAQKGSSVEITNCEIIVSETESDAVRVTGASDVKLTNVKITADDCGVISHEANNTVEVIGCEIYSDFHGVYHNGSYAPATITIRDTTIVDTASSGVYISNSTSHDKLQILIIDNCNITGEMTAVEVKHTNATITNSILTSTLNNDEIDDQSLNKTRQGVTASQSSVSAWGYAFASTINKGEVGKGRGTVTLNGNTYNIPATIKDANIHDEVTTDVALIYTEPGVTCVGSDFT